MKNPNLKHVAAGDRILAASVETEITAVLDDGARLADGQMFEEHAFFGDGVLVIPQGPPAELTAMIDLQPTRRARSLVIVRRLGGRGEPTFTIADRKTGETLRSTIHTEEEADVSYGNGAWEEGKPAISECWTEYFVGSDEFKVPEGFEPERYL